MSVKAKILLIIAIAFLVTAPIKLLLWYSWGAQSGEEFSPDNFSRRHFTYNKDPIFGIVLHGREYTDVTSPLEKSLVTSGLIKPRIGPQATWQLVSEMRTTDDRESAECDARFLTRYLDHYTTEGDNVWNLFNTDYPNLAKQFWPVVAEMARDDMYLKIPPVMEFALDFQSRDVQQFTRRLDELKAAAYRDLGKLDFDNGNFQRARYRLQKADQISPADDLKRMISDCNSKLPEDSK